MGSCDKSQKSPAVAAGVSVSTTAVPTRTRRTVSSNFVVFFLSSLVWCSCAISGVLSEPSWSNLPHKMSPGELMHHFDVEDPNEVPADSYEVVQVTRRSVITKRGGGGEEEPSHDAALEIKAFDRNFDLKIKRNSRLVSPFVKMVQTHGQGRETELDIGDSFRSCHYLINHEDGFHGGISDCHSEYRGYIFHGAETFDLTPLNQRLHKLEGIHTNQTDYHLIRKSGNLMGVCMEVG